ncbi:MAG: phenylalanyl-tRNA synthetase alpha chain [Pyrinomonadaceae bacterium]|jgi:phenylalanyl-tRNA synthetase alpha chain|nr:phenylalanyl-tRNA synthetase alpha chain [Pyrinomonadaceae bacterium]
MQRPFHGLNQIGAFKVMTNPNSPEDPRVAVESARKAFEQEFERFVRLTDASALALSLADAETEQRALADLRTRHMGKKSALAACKKLIGKVAPDERAAFGQLVQRAEAEITERVTTADETLNSLLQSARRERDRIDVTLPGRRPRQGHIHPITKLRERIEDIFVSLGYAIEDDREIETDFYNFDALNIPANHPARAPQDTFYTTEGFALRSQTSTVQIHAMQRRGVPLRMIAPGRVFRRDTPDPTHNPMFFQVEGLCVDRGITMAHLKGTVAEFLRRMFGAQTVTRFRPSYFPFTEPSAEFDFSCFKCGGSGCRICKQSGWIELGGSGMVHPNVLRIAGVDPEIYSGFAFGLGIDRMCALMYGLDDIRLLFENDIRFLEQFD